VRDRSNLTKHVATWWKFPTIHINKESTKDKSFEP
jgi:hypothetical protein